MSDHTYGPGEGPTNQLDELIAANEEMHGPLTQEEIDAAEREMFGEGGATGRRCERDLGSRQ